MYNFCFPIRIVKKYSYEWMNETKLIHTWNSIYLWCNTYAVSCPYSVSFRFVPLYLVSLYFVSFRWFVLSLIAIALYCASLTCALCVIFTMHTNHVSHGWALIGWIKLLSRQSLPESYHWAVRQRLSWILVCSSFEYKKMNPKPTKSFHCSSCIFETFKLTLFEKFSCDFFTIKYCWRVLNDNIDQ